MFEFFDPADELRVTQGNLPHWYQPGVTYFVTFRTEDSLPSEVHDLWRRRREDWLRRHKIDPRKPSWKAALQNLPIEVQREFHKTFSKEYLAHLDKGYGACVLRRRDLALIVAKSLKHFDGNRYYLGDFVVMPNHVHLLACLLGETEIEAQCYSWKKFTAVKINQALGQQGRFWQEESFDNLVRSPDGFDGARRYIANNGEQAGLNPDEYMLSQWPNHVVTL